MTTQCHLHKTPGQLPITRPQLVKRRIYGAHQHSPSTLQLQVASSTRRLLCGPNVLPARIPCKDLSANPGSLRNLTVSHLAWSMNQSESFSNTLMVPSMWTACYSFEPDNLILLFKSARRVHPCLFLEALLHKVGSYGYALGCCSRIHSNILVQTVSCNESKIVQYGW